MPEITKDYITAHRAWEKLKAAKSLRQPVYLYGATGYGKTELVRQFLGQSKYLYYSCMEAGLTEDFPDCPAGGAGKIMVIDDLQLLTEEAKQQKVIALAKQENVWLILVSRSMLPGWLMSFYVKSGLLLIEENDLKLKAEDVGAYLLDNQRSLTPTEMEFLLTRSDGNAYLIQYALRKAREGAALDAKLEQDLFETFALYLEKHVVVQWENELAEFLTQISVVEHFTSTMAEYITGNSRVPQLLEKAAMAGNFLWKENEVYRLRPVLRYALKRRAAMVYGSQRMKEYMYNAGLYYEMQDEIVEALRMYEQAENSDRIRELLIRNARRNPGNGHYYELRKYYFRLKEEEIADNPVLMAGMSMLYGMLLQEEKSEYWYGKLKKFADCSAGGQRREALGRLAYLDISLAHRGSRGVLDILKSIPAALFSKGVKLPEFSVTSNLPSIMNGGKDFLEWSLNDRLLMKTIGPLLEQVLGRYGKGLPYAALAESLYEKGEDAYEVLSLLSKAQMKMEAGGVMEIAFACVGVQVRLNLLYGNESAATELLDAFEKKCITQKAGQLLPNLAAMRCRIALYMGKKQAVTQWMEEGPKETEFYILDRYRYLTKVRCYLYQGDYLSAYGLLEQLRYYADKCSRIYILMEIELLTAIVKYRMGREEWKEHMSLCLKQAQHYKMRRPISEEGAAVWELLQKIEKETDPIDKKWFSEVLAETGKMAKQYPGYLKGQVAELPDFPENALEILRLQAEGLPVGEIARRLDMKVETVRYHTKQNYKKLGVSGKTDAVLTARNMGIL